MRVKTGKTISMSIQERKFKVEGKRACFAGLKLGHSSKQCKTFIKCLFCDKKHLILLCPDLINARTSVAAKQDQTRSTKNQVAMSAVSCSSAVYVQTIRVKIKGPNGEKVVRALIDTRSQKFYVLNSTAEELGLRSYLTQPIIHSLFGGQSTDVTVHNQHEVEVWSVVIINQ